jgi:hypothetical protein
MTGNMFGDSDKVDRYLGKKKGKGRSGKKEGV